MDLGNFFALVLTAIGTIITIWQASKAKSYRDEILEDRQKLSLIELKSSLKHVRSECKKITTPVNKPFRGVDTQKVIDELQDFLDKMKENTHKIKLDKFQKSIISIEVFIQNFKDESDPNERNKIGDKLFKELSDLGGLIAENIDKKM